MQCLDRALGWCQVLKKAAEKKELVQVALNTHGTRAVQKLIETLTTREQVRPASMRTASLTGLQEIIPCASCFPCLYAV